MFIQSRSARTKINWDAPLQKDRSWLRGSDRLCQDSHPQAKMPLWELCCYKFLLGSPKSSSSKKYFNSNIISYFRFCFPLLLFISMILRPHSGCAQSIQPLTPERSTPPQTQPLIPGESPLNELDTPPVPESVLDIPGAITVEQFQFAGNTVYSQAELNLAIASFTGKPISFAQLIQAADTITEFYVNRGYITTGAYVPIQNLSSGVVKIQIVEGSLSEIKIEIDQGRLKPNYIRNRLTSKLSTPLNIDRLQESLQLLQLDPLIDSIDAELSAGVKPGTNSLAVSVMGADTFSVQTKLNNNRNPSIGTFERSVKLEEANLLGIGDNIFFAYANTNGSNQFEGGYSLPLNASNGSLSFDFRSANNEIVESDLQEADIDIQSRNYNLTWRQPIIQRAKPEVSQELSLSVGASKRASETSILDIPQGISPGANDLGETRTSVISLGQEWLQRNRQEVVFARSQFNLGIDAFDATVDTEEPDSQFFNWRGQVSYLRLLSNPKGTPAIGSTLLLRSELQLAADPLIPTEQFSLGGVQTVRGYRQDALLTDNGFSASAELRFPIARTKKLNTSLQVIPFVDFGTGWNSDNEDTEFSTLLGTGVGLSLQSETRFSARLDWGIPLINSSSGDRSLQEDGVYLQLQYELF